MPKRETVENTGKGVAIYHIVYARETFEQAAPILLKLVAEAQKNYPDQPRHLYLDIDGHKNKAGGWDTDMWELQMNFVCKWLSRFLTSMTLPLGRISMNNRPQQNTDIPEDLNVLSSDAQVPEGTRLVNDDLLQ